MPTENRSSNTEMVSALMQCPFCGEKPQITKHHREDIYSFMHRCPVLGPISWGFREDQQAHIEKWNARAQPAPQPHPDPIAWMVGTAFWWTKEEAERDAAETGLPVVGLGSMAGVAPAQHQGEPVALPGRKRDSNEDSDVLTDCHNGGWNACLGEIAKLGPLYIRPVQGEPVARVEVGPDRNACLTITDNDWLRALKCRAMHQVVPLYPHADPGEIERLRADAVTQKAIADEAWAEVEKCRENSRIITQQVDTLRTQLAEAQALLRTQDELLAQAYQRDIGTPLKREIREISAALSASAEPSDVACRI
ncbi:Lar family restriction alleviation protein [Pseudomonas juntendi]|uniref:Lar family restriction alleviation protein n=1 Tax=Pseudomonas juntendi TaxID=2666183 RepID=UPI002117C9AF|nr:Lar family restriction alleviation protein [Pseudomonas juntendi]